MIIERILSFLQYDLSNLFNLSHANICMCCCSDDSISTETNSTDSADEKCIGNVYKPRPKIVCECGCQDCPEVNEQEEQNVDNCDNSEISVDGIDDRDDFDCADERTDDMESEPSAASSEAMSNESCCQSLCRKIVEIVTNRCSGATVTELHGIEERAYSLWNTLNTCARENGSSRAKYPNWWDLRSWQKLPFYWAALSNEILSEDPFENFKRFFSENKQTSSRCRWSKKRNERLLIVWHGFCIKQRMPFIMEAFIARVSAGKVNIRDDREIQRVIGELHNK